MSATSMRAPRRSVREDGRADGADAVQRARGARRSGSSCAAVSGRRDLDVDVLRVAGALGQGGGDLVGGPGGGS